MSVNIKEELNRIQAYMQYGENTDIDVFFAGIKKEPLQFIRKWL